VSSSRPRWLAGGAAIIAAAGAIRLTGWLAQDSGLLVKLNGSWVFFVAGTSMREATRGRFAVAVAVLGASVAIVGLVLALRRRPASVVGVVAVAGVALVVAGWMLYPRAHDAVLVVTEPDGSTWRLDTDMREVFGSREVDDRRIVLVAHDDIGRSCDWRSYLVTVDLVERRIVEVEEQPTWFASQADVPPPPAPLDPERFTIHDGSSLLICSS
jgi:hypothetical protein